MQVSDLLLLYTVPAWFCTLATAAHYFLAGPAASNKCRFVMLCQLVFSNS